MKRFLHEFLHLTPAIILTVLFCKVKGKVKVKVTQRHYMKVYWQVEFRISLWNENRQNKFIWGCQYCWYEISIWST